MTYREIEYRWPTKTSDPARAWLLAMNAAYPGTLEMRVETEEGEILALYWDAVRFISPPNSDGVLIHNT